MKKAFKKMAVGLIVTATLISLAENVFAGGDASNKITIINEDGPGHTYEAYKIFSGTKASDGAGLAQVDWGDGVDAAALLTELKSDEAVKASFADCKAASDVARVLSKDTSDADLAREFARCAGMHLGKAAGVSTENASPYTISLAEPGYYLVKDKDKSLESMENAAYTPYLLSVAGSVQLHAKEKIPTVEKKVKEGDKWQDAADSEIGQTVHFQLTGTTSNYTSNYKTYAYTFSDTSDAGLAADVNSVKVYHDEVSEASLISGGYTAAYNSDRHLLTVAIADAKTCVKDFSAATKLIVTYDARVTDQAATGEKGNDNKVKVTYSNNPYGSGTGTSTEDKVTVFTFKLTCEKVDKDGKALKGAGFTLMRKDGDSWTKFGAETTNDMGSTFTFAGLKNGTYKLEETTAPDGYEPITPITFTVRGTYDTQSEDPKLTAFEILSEDGEAFSDDQARLTIPSIGEAHLVITDIAGASLPETGGRARDFAILLIGAALIVSALVTRKRI